MFCNVRHNIHFFFSLLEKTSNIDTTRSVTVQHVSNYSISLVPLVSRILNMIPKIINKITQFQRNSSQQVKGGYSIHYFIVIKQEPSPQIQSMPDSNTIHARLLQNLKNRM